MAWSSFPTLTDGQVLTGAHMQIIRDNFLETAAAKATTAGRIFVATGANTLAERAISGASVQTVETTTSTSYTNLTTSGPQVTVTTGAQALVWINARPANATAGVLSIASFEVSGATTRAASDNESVYIDDPDANSIIRACSCTLVTGLTAGSNTFKMVYKSGAGGTAGFAYRHIVVMGL
jgi:hypothetical protein